ncbi:TPA: DUF2971 domain-containing protein [Klebsiella pneumoniae]
MLNMKDTHGPVPEFVSDGKIKLINERLFNFTLKRISYINGALCDGFSDAHNFISYIPSGKVREHNSPNYFHYTSVDNFKNIIHSGSFWASQLGAMNDPKELTYAQEKLIHQIFLLCESIKIEKNTVTHIIKNISTFFDRYIFNDFFCISLSKRGNLSSQWSKYSCENGVSFSLNTKIINYIPDFYNKAILTDVVYDPSEQLKILSRLAQDMMESKILLLNEKSAHAILNEQFKESLTYITVAFKHAFYMEEEEYRIVIPSKGNESHIKTKPDGISKYMHIEFMNIYKYKEDIDIPIEYIFTAPTKNERKALHNINKLLSAKNIKFGMIIGSGASFIWPNK